MSDQKTPCLYCQTLNEAGQSDCKNCGMPIAEYHPQSRKRGLKLFHKAFWLIVIFCVFMIFYLPR
ncbi:DnrP protein [Thalassotalea fonticola]|uniref:DnrP protein n=1 Tax=Thalassotalea fonticola TaxID=3065649 RepID=A0ABZ0GK45_9GAMM|nr:DnrP protein [Colwelliaceae bacterium S1-1]